MAIKNGLGWARKRGKALKAHSQNFQQKRGKKTWGERCPRAGKGGFENWKRGNLGRNDQGVKTTIFEVSLYEGGGRKGCNAGNDGQAKGKGGGRPRGRRESGRAF